MDEMRARRFEDRLKYKIKSVIHPLVLPKYVDVLDCAIIVEQDEMEKRKSFDNKRWQNLKTRGRVDRRNKNQNQTGETKKETRGGKDRHSRHVIRII